MFDTEKILKHLGDLMRASRQEKNLSQAKAAKKIGMCYRHYQDVERGKIDIRFETMFYILKFYGIKFCELDIKGR